MISDISSPVDSIRSFFRHPIFLILLAGVVIRLFIFPFFEVGYDSDFWATIVRNLESGEGLYGLEGYYYTPVWGYILSFMSVLQESFLNIDVLGARIVEAFPIESYTDWFLTATVTSVTFNFWIKIPFLICDIIVGYLIYWLIMDKTQDTKKATIGFALWFLCPLIICVTSISGMFDTFSVLFTLLCIIMVRKDKLFLAGVLFAFAVLTKFFPAYLIFIFVAYILVKHRDDGLALKGVMTAAIGALIGFVILMAPQIIDGTVGESLLFITARTGGGDTATLLEQIASKGAIVIYAMGILVSIVLAALLSKKDKSELDDSFFKYILLMATFIFIYPPAPQYLVLLIPFLAIYMVTKDMEFKKSWILISLGGMFFVFGSNFALLLSLGTFTDIVSLDYIMSMVEWFNSPLVFGVSPMYLVYNGAGMVQYIGVISIGLLFYHKERLNKKKDQKPLSNGPDVIPVRSFFCRKSKG